MQDKSLVVARIASHLALFSVGLSVGSTIGHDTGKTEIEERYGLSHYDATSRDMITDSTESRGDTLIIHRRSK